MKEIPLVSLCIAGAVLAVLFVYRRGFNRGHDAGWIDHQLVYNKAKEPLRNSRGRFARKGAA